MRETHKVILKEQKDFDKTLKTSEKNFQQEVVNKKKSMISLLQNEKPGCTGPVEVAS